RQRDQAPRIHLRAGTVESSSCVKPRAKGRDMKLMKHHEVIAVGELIRAHFKKNAEGVWAWDAGWTDTKVAHECKIPGVTTDHVSRLRKAAYGDIPKPRKVTPFEAYQQSTRARMDALEKRITELEAAATAPPPKGNAHSADPSKRPTLSLNFDKDKPSPP